MKLTQILISALMPFASVAAYAEAPADYYVKAEGKQNEALLTQLCAIVGPHTTISYDGLWDVYETSDIDADGRVWDMYSTKRWTLGKEHCGNYKYVGDCINREHSMPKSWFSDASPMVSDAFHVYPTDGKVNGQRSNYPYGECAEGTTLPSSNGYDALGKLGTSTFPGYSGKVFEPVDDYKGDFARTYFYMAAAYNGRISNWNSDMLAGNSYPAFSSWAVDLLLKWHRQDPVSQKEIARNDAVYAKQHNRNPFIDHPELAEYIWGNKKGEAWYPNATADPQIQLPADGYTIDFGLTSVGYNISRSLKVKGASLDAPVTLTVSPSTEGFTISRTSLTASEVNSGTDISVTFCGQRAGRTTATLTVKCGDLQSAVTLIAEAVDGIPALPATNVSETSFTARWTDIGTESYYQLTVNCDDVTISGYPVKVYAADEEYTVSDLDPATTYTYRLSDGTSTSNAVTVTTLELLPSVQYTGDLSNEVTFAVKPDTNSDAVEMWIETENIFEPLTVSVEAPFELSTDVTNWAHSIVMQPEEDRFFVRVAAAAEGTYERFITITSGEYVNEDGHLVALVSDVQRATFTEGFEEASKTNGASGSYNGNIYTASNGITWTLSDAGIWSESNHTPDGKYSVRFGKSASSCMETTTIAGGVGTVSFYAAAWSASEGMTLTVEYIKESDLLSRADPEWIPAGEVTIDSDAMNLFTVTVNSPGNNRLRFRQTAGGRSNIDDIEVAPFAGLDSVEGVIAESDWTSYGLNGALTIANYGSPKRFFVYDLEGRTRINSDVNSTLSVKVEPGLYIVTDGDEARRVVVR